MSPTRALRLYGRALRLRCPNCGEGAIMASWFRTTPKCSACSIRTERGEEDFFLGSMMFNIILSEGLLVVFLVALVVGLWPNVPWTFLTYGAPALMAAAPFAVFPWTKALWLASDILIRPVSEEEMDWHRGNQDDSFRPYSVR